MSSSSSYLDAKPCKRPADFFDNQSRAKVYHPASQAELMEAMDNQNFKCATQGLDFYNKTNGQGVEYELVKPIATCPIARGRLGFSLHGNFLAKPKGACGDSSVELFFAETWATKLPQGQPEVLKCCILKPDPRANDNGAKPWKIYHPEDIKCNWCNLPKRGEVTL